MTNTSRTCAAFLLFLALLTAADVALASDAQKQGREQARRMQQRIGALEQEKSQLDQEKSQVEGQLKDTSEQLAHTRRSMEAARRKGALLEQDLKTAADEKAALADKLAQAEQKLAETESSLAEMTQARQDTQAQLDASLQQRQKEYSQYTAMNESLHRLGMDLLKRYQEKSCMASILQKDPLTQLGSVGIENTLEDYREKLDQAYADQQQEERHKLARQQAIARMEEQAKAEREQAERLQAEQEKTERLQARQQNDLDRITRKVKSLFEDIEW